MNEYLRKQLINFEVYMDLMSLEFEVGSDNPLVIEIKQRLWSQYREYIDDKHWRIFHLLSRLDDLAHSRWRVVYFFKPNSQGLAALRAKTMLIDLLKEMLGKELDVTNIIKLIRLAQKNKADSKVNALIGELYHYFAERMMAPETPTGISEPLKRLLNKPKLTGWKLLKEKISHLFQPKVHKLITDRKKLEDECQISARGVDRHLQEDLLSYHKIYEIAADFYTQSAQRSNVHIQAKAAYLYQYEAQAFRKAIKTYLYPVYEKQWVISVDILGKAEPVTIKPINEMYNMILDGEKIHARYKQGIYSSKPTDQELISDVLWNHLASAALEETYKRKSQGDGLEKLPDLMERIHAEDVFYKMKKVGKDNRHSAPPGTINLAKAKTLSSVRTRAQTSPVFAANTTFH